MRILYECFTACPGEGSENGNGWNVPLAIARRGHQVRVLVSDHNHAYVERIRAALVELGPELAAVGGSLDYWVAPIPAWARRVRPGLLRTYAQYQGWLRSAVPAEQPRITAFAPDLTQHLTLGSLQGASRLPLVCAAPFIMGPCGGGQMAPWRMIPALGIGSVWEVVRNLIVLVSRSGLMRPPGIRRAALVLTSNQDTSRCAKAMGAPLVATMQDATVPHGFRPETLPARDWHAPVLEVLWIAQLLPRKVVLLAVRAMELLGPGAAFQLRIVGGGPEQSRLQRRLARSPAAASITYVGKIPFTEVQAEYRRAHLFLFTSVRDSNPVQILEAMCWGLPIVALDLHGCHDHLDTTGAQLVQASTFEATARRLAGTLQELAGTRARLASMSTANHLLSQQSTLEAKVEDFAARYRTLGQNG